MDVCVDGMPLNVDEEPLDDVDGVYACVCVWMHVYVWMDVCMDGCMYGWMDACVYGMPLDVDGEPLDDVDGMYGCVCVWMHVYGYVCMHACVDIS
jgi:hypothetical protein